MQSGEVREAKEVRDMRGLTVDEKDWIEKRIDQCTLSHVLAMLGEIAEEKAEHIRTN